MKKVIAALLLMLCILGLVSVCCAKEPLPYALERRIYYVNDECFIVRDDGTVYLNQAAKKDFPEVAEWTDIQAISVDVSTVLGLKRDGTVVATGWDNNFGVLDVDGWKDMIQVEADLWCSYGLTKEGNLIHTGEIFHEDQETFARYEWCNLKEIAADSGYLFAITDDGHVISTFDDDFSELEDVVHIYAEDMDAYFLHGDGSYSLYSIYGEGFLCRNRERQPLYSNRERHPAQISIFRERWGSRSVYLDSYGRIHADEYSGYNQLDAEFVLAVCGGIYVDGLGGLHSIVEMDTEEPLPTIDLRRYERVGEKWETQTGGSQH